MDGMGSSETQGGIAGLASRLALMRIAVWGIGAIAVFGGGMVALSTARGDDGAVAAGAAGAITLLVGIGLLCTADIGRQAGAIWFLIWGILALVASVLSVTAESVADQVRDLLFALVPSGALMAIGLWMASKPVTFVVGYLGRGRITPETTAEALRRACAGRDKALQSWAEARLGSAPSPDAAAPAAEAPTGAVGEGRDFTRPNNGARS